MGLVYEGIQPLIGKRVAVKVLRPSVAADAEQVARLLAEARAVNAIRHRGIIDIFGFGQLPRRPAVHGHGVPGGRSRSMRIWPRRGRCRRSEALAILDEVLGALAAAHGAGVVHRDLKPEQHLPRAQPDGSRYVKLLDFGLAKHAAGADARTRRRARAWWWARRSTWRRSRPAARPVGPLTDLYALGIVTFEMLTGRLPFIGTSPVDLVMKHVDARPPRPSEFVPGLPARSMPSSCRC